MARVAVHTTPALAPLPASDAESIRLLAYLRAAGVSFSVATASWEANGKPFVTFNDLALDTHHLSTLPSFVDPDADLTPSERSDTTTWLAFLDGQLSDLVNHTMYSLPPNYPMVAKAQLAALPFPLSYYVPQRLRSTVKSRLEAVGLWGLGGLLPGEEEGPEGERKSIQDSVVVAPGGTKTPRAWSGWRAGREVAERQRKFGEQALLTRARATLDPLARKLASTREAYFYSPRPTSLDIALFAYLSLLLEPEWPNPLLGTLLREEYASLVAHHARVGRALFPRGWAGLVRLDAGAGAGAVSGSGSGSGSGSAWTGLGSSLGLGNWGTLGTALRSSLPTWLGGISAPQGTEENETPAEKAERTTQAMKERQFALARWAWFAGAGIALVTYVFAAGIVSVDFGGEGDWEEDGEGGWVTVGGDDEEDEDEEEEDEEEEQEEDEREKDAEAAALQEYAEEHTRWGGLPVWEDGEEPDEEED